MLICCAANASGALKVKCSIAPLLGSDIANSFGEVPAMPVKVLRIVLALAIRLICGFGQDGSPVLPRAFAVPHSIFNANLNDVGIVRRDISFGDGEAALASLHLDAVIGDAEANGEAKSFSEPIGGDTGIWVNKHWNHRARRHRLVVSHFKTLSFDVVRSANQIPACYSFPS